LLPVLVTLGNIVIVVLPKLGTGTFKGNEQSQPFIGQAGGAREQVAEEKNRNYRASAFKK